MCEVSLKIAPDPDLDLPGRQRYAVSSPKREYNGNGSCLLWSESAFSAACFRIDEWHSRDEVHPGGTLCEEQIGFPASS
jgi:hypothetical protein